MRSWHNRGKGKFVMLLSDPASFDLDAYLTRIGDTGPREPTLDTLRRIHLRHAETIAFENLNPLLGWPVKLDTKSLQRKLVYDRRGGYCFEQNLLLAHAFDALGFRITGLAARVLWNVPEGAVPARGHMLLHVVIEGRPYIADVGFGGLTLTGPLRLEAGVEQHTPHEPFRLDAAGDEFVLRARVRDSWQALYRFSLQPQLLPDYELTSWYLSHFPGSHFVTGLIAARPAPDRRYALRNGELAVHYLDGRTERRVLADARELRQTLEGPLGLRLPSSVDLDAALERLTTSQV
jgi:N-hydroxyarylamine O-acetyltransferase